MDRGPAATRPLLRVPHQRRGRGPRFPAFPGNGGDSSSADRSGRPGRRRCPFRQSLSPANSIHCWPNSLSPERTGSRRCAVPAGPCENSASTGWPQCCRSTGPWWRSRPSPPPDSLGIYTTWIESEFAAGWRRTPRSAPPRPTTRDEPSASRWTASGVALGLPADLLDGLARTEAVWDRNARHCRGSAEAPAARTDGDLLAKMAGTVVKWLAEPGDAVEQGQPVLVLEAMKMETAVAAHRAMARWVNRSSRPAMPSPRTACWPPSSEAACRLPAAGRLSWNHDVHGGA